MNATIPILTFVIGQQTYGLRIADVVEVAAMVEVLTLPHAPQGVLGMVNRHSEMIALLDLRVVFATPIHTLSDNTFFIVAEWDSLRLGLVVDAVDLVKYVLMQAFQPVPGNPYVSAIVQDDGRAVQILEAAALFAHVLPQVES